jgi:hypothetical protein
MRGVWAKISQEEIISANFVQGKKNSFLVFYTPVHKAPPNFSTFQFHEFEDILRCFIVKEG